MEKHSPAYDLKVIKFAFSTPKKLRMTASALPGARAMEFSMKDIVDAIQQLKRTDFIKSITTYLDHRIWQDVYNTEFKDHMLYIKFQIDAVSHFVISFKEK